MKKTVSLLLICLMAGSAFAFQSAKKANSAVNNDAITKSKKEQDKQTKEFLNHKRYSSVVNSHKAKAQKKQPVAAKSMPKG